MATELRLIRGKIVRVEKPKSLKQTPMYKRFLELCKKSVKFEDLKEGFVCYSSFDSKIVIASKPYISKYTNSLFVDIICKYESTEGTSQDYTTIMSLNDRNIIGGGYNLHRVFAKKEDSLEYIEITREYSYFGRDKWGDLGLRYTITPIAGPDMVIDPNKFEVR